MKKSCKPFLSYAQQLELLKFRGMWVENDARALKKLQEIGYYRLSGFSYPCRKFSKDANGCPIPSEINPKIFKRDDVYLYGTTFDKVVNLYLFDKSLRLLILDAIERIEIYMRVLIAHELGRVDPLFYNQEKFFIKRGKFIQWHQKLQELIDKSLEDCIRWHVIQHKLIPIWVCVQIWNFGMLSKFFSLLKQPFRNIICKQIDDKITPPILINWLYELTILRNRCAHHARIWNRTDNNIKLPAQFSYFNNLFLTQDGLNRIASRIAVLCFFVNHLGRTSHWINRCEKLLLTLPNLPNVTPLAMGFNDIETTFNHINSFLKSHLNKYPCLNGFYITSKH